MNGRLDQMSGAVNGPLDQWFHNKIIFMCARRDWNWTDATAQATNAYGRGYTTEQEDGGTGWPASYLEGMTEAELAVMEMPYHPRLNRVVVSPDGAGVIHPAPREKHKVDFDRAVFKSDYF